MVVIGSLVVDCVGPRPVVTIGLVVTDGLVVTGSPVVGGLVVADLVEAGLVIGCVVSGPKSRIQIYFALKSIVLLADRV